LSASRVMSISSSETVGGADRWLGSRLLVHLKPYSEGNSAVASALAVAKTFDASLTGIYAIRELAMLKLIIGQDSSLPSGKRRLAMPL